MDTTGLFIDTDGEGNTCLWRHNPNQPALPTMVAATYNTDPQVWAIITAAINAHPEPASEPRP